MLHVSPVSHRVEESGRVFARILVDCTWPAEPGNPSHRAILVGACTSVPAPAISTSGVSLVRYYAVQDLMQTASPSFILKQRKTSHQLPGSACSTRASQTGCSKPWVPIVSVIGLGLGKAWHVPFGRVRCRSDSWTYSRADIPSKHRRGVLQLEPCLKTRVIPDSPRKQYDRIGTKCISMILSCGQGFDLGWGCRSV